MGLLVLSHCHLGIPRRPGVVWNCNTLLHGLVSAAFFPEGDMEIGLLLDQLSVICLCVVSFKHFLCQKRLFTGY